MKKRVDHSIYGNLMREYRETHDFDKLAKAMRIRSLYYDIKSADLENSIDENLEI